MRLKQEALSSSVWQEGGFELPEYHRQAMIAQTGEHPQWLHFGAGNIFRAFPAVIQQRLLNQGKSDFGIVVAEGFDREIIQKAYRPYDNLSLLVVLKADGTVEKKVVGSVAESLEAFWDSPDWNRLQEIFASPKLQMVSFTITEKGYSLTDLQGRWLPAVEGDFDHPQKPEHIIGKLAALCLYRYQKGAFPVALVSMDNCSHNGEKLRNAVLAMAEQWVKRGLAPQGYYDYLADPEQVSFPWTMIDKITPRPDPSVTELLRDSGFEDTDLIVTDKGTYTAPFVNAEEAEYLVVEDRFPNGRPPLEAGGVIFTDRETVNTVERMKVCTCLNPLHTALAIFGCLLSFQSIHGEMEDAALKKLVYGLGYDEGMPVVPDPKIIDPKAFIREVLEERLPNPFIPDTPQRIATDTSQKLSVRFGETLKAHQTREDLSVQKLKLIPLVFAGWCRYLMGVDDQGNPFQISPDPMQQQLQSCLAGIHLGDTGPFGESLKPILSNASIFGVDLVEIGMAGQVEEYFRTMVSGTGMVRKLLEQVTGE